MHKEPKLSADSAKSTASRWIPKSRQQELAFAWLHDGDQAARNELLEASLPQMRRTARYYSRFGIPYQDLYQEAVAGWLGGLRSYDFSKDETVSDHCWVMMNRTVTTYVARNIGPVSLNTDKKGVKKAVLSWQRIAGEVEKGLTKGRSPYIRRDLFFKTLSTEFRARSAENEMSADKIATVYWIIADRLGQEKMPIFEAPVATSTSLVWISSSPEALIERIDRKTTRRRLRQAIMQLPTRQRLIIEWRRLAEEPKAVKQVAGLLGISTERVRQLEHEAMAKLRRTLTAGHLKPAQPGKLKD